MQDVQQYENYCDTNYPSTTISSTTTKVFVPLPFVTTATPVSIATDTKGLISG